MSYAYHSFSEMRLGVALYFLWWFTDMLCKLVTLASDYLFGGIDFHVCVWSFSQGQLNDSFGIVPKKSFDWKQSSNAEVSLFLCVVNEPLFTLRKHALVTHLLEHLCMCFPLRVINQNNQCLNHSISNLVLLLKGLFVPLNSLCS